MLSAAGTVGPLAGSGVAMLIADALPALSHAAARFSTATVTYALGSSTAPLAVSQARAAVKTGAPVLSPSTAFSKPFDFRTFAAQPATATKPEETKSEETPNSDVNGLPKGTGVSPHPGIQEDILKANEREDSYFLMQPHYPDKEYLENIRPFHREPTKFYDYTGYFGVKALRKTFDVLTGYGPNMNEKKWLTRFLFLETVAGVPGMVGGMLRHLRSLRTMERDKGWIHTLLEEAENERLHLLTFMEMAKPGLAFRSAVIGAQGLVLALYTMFYVISPRHCHAFVSYLEEEAVKTYSHCIDDLDAGKLPEWNHIAVPDIAKRYWRLGPNASMRDLLLAIRADELCHNHVNEVFSNLPQTAPNPFAPGTTIVA